MYDLSTNPHVRFILFVFYFAVGYYVTVNWLPSIIVWLMPFLLAYMIAYMTRPIVRFLHANWRIKEKASATISLVLVLLVFCSVVGYLSTKIVIEVINFAQKYQTYLTELTGYSNYMRSWLLVFKDTLPSGISDLFESSISSITEFANTTFTAVANQILASVATFAAKIPGIVIFLLVFVMASFFLCRDYTLITNSIKAQINPKNRKQVLEIKGYAITAISKYFRGMFFISLTVYIVVLIGFLILRVDYAYIMALFVAFLDMLPLVGAGVILVPWGIFCLVTGNIAAGVGLLALCLIAAIVRQIVEPRIISKSLGLHPIITLIAMYVGLKSIGILGVFLFPIIILVLVYIQRSGAIVFWKTDNEIV